MRNKPHISFHRVVGSVLALLLFNMALSGILLNHRAITARIPIPRCFLPPSYHVGNWNNQLVKGTLRLAPDSILLYGAAGLFLVDSLWQDPRPFSQGLPPDLAPVNALLKLLTGEVIAATPKGLFTYSDSGRWTLFLSSPEPLIDLTYADSVLYALSRSNLYVLPPPYQHLQPVSLPSVEGVSKDVRLFKLIWFLHSGEFFGLLGRLVVDALGVVMMILSVTGIVAMLSRRIGCRLKVRAHRLRHSRRWMRSLKLHTWQGRWLLLPLLLLILTGMMLRPPLLIAIVRYYIAPPAFSPLHSDNPWHDRLRKIAFNPATHTLLLSTSVGFFSAFPHDLQLRPLYPAPPVSVMGCTVLRPQGNGWLVGSFSGLYLWEPQASCIVNAVTREPCVPRQGMPIFSNQTVAGFSTDFASTPLLFDYYRGAVPLVATQQSPHMPSALKDAPISLWHLALELHTGRLYGLNGSVVGESLFIFLLGLLGLLLLVTGYRKWRWLAPRKR
jgi:putative iron-regulated transmembrane protein